MISNVAIIISGYYPLPPMNGIWLIIHLKDLKPKMESSKAIIKPIIVAIVERGNIGLNIPT